jgi:2-amino-4-hydroxy-6-hydroxymethyldihydropteridine diphosphokinase
VSDRALERPAGLVLGLGGNTGDVVGQFEAVARSMAARGPVRASRVYRSAPIGPAQPDFLNAALAIALAVDPPPAELAACVARLERRAGRDRATEIPWGPRPLDVDVLVWGDRVGRWDRLVVPHPRLAERRFVLEPLVDLFGEAYVVPGVGRTVGELLAAVADQRLEVTELRLPTTA